MLGSADGRRALGCSLTPVSGPLSGRVVLLSGAESLLGLGLALAVARAGASVGLLGHVDHEVVAGLGAAHARLVVAPTDFDCREDVEEAVAFAVERLGPADAVVHTAMDPVAFERRPIAEVDDAHFEAVWEGTMEATLWLMQAAYGAFTRRSADGRTGGRIVVTVPTLAMEGSAGLVAYAAATEGQRLLVKSAARQWGPQGITVNCLAVAPALAGVAPVGVGPADHGLAPPALGRVGDPELDVGPALVFLLGDGGSFVTGATVCVDGGLWMAP